MEIKKDRRNLATVIPGIWWVLDKIDAHQRRKCAKADMDAIDNLERLYKLKERGVLTEAEFTELKSKIKERI